MLRSGLKTVARDTEFLINTLLTLLCYFALCAAVIAVTHSGYCRCGACEDCKLRREGDEETTMTQATVLTATIWPRVALFNYFAVPMPPQLAPLVFDTWPVGVVALRSEIIAELQRRGIATA